MYYSTRGQHVITILKHQYAYLYCALYDVKTNCSLNKLFLTLQLANYCNIALNKETLLLLHPLGHFSSVCES